MYHIYLDFNTLESFSCSSGPLTVAPTRLETQRVLSSFESSPQLSQLTRQRRSVPGCGPHQRAAAARWGSKRSTFLPRRRR